MYVQQDRLSSVCLLRGGKEIYLENVYCSLESNVQALIGGTEMIAHNT